MHAKVLRTPPRFSIGRVVRKFTSIVAWVSLPTSTRSPVPVWQTVFGFFFLDKTLTCPLSSVARETTWYELPESKSQKILSPDSMKEGATIGIAKYGSLKERSDALLCTLPNIALRSGLAAWRLWRWRCLGGCRGTPRSGAPRASVQCLWLLWRWLRKETPAAACLSQQSRAQCPFLPQWWHTSVFLALLLARAEEPFPDLSFSFPLLALSARSPLPFPFVSFPLSFVSFARLPFVAFSFVTLVPLSGTERVEVPVVVLLLEGKDTKLLVVKLQPL